MLRHALAICLLALLPLQAAEAETWSDHEYTCPLDGVKFKGKQLASASRHGRRLDLRWVGGIPQPIPYPVCPGSGFVMFQTSIGGDKDEPFTEPELSILRSVVTTEEYRRERAAHTDHHMIAYMWQKLGRSDRALMTFYLQASWEAENADNAALNRSYILLSLEQAERLARTLEPRSNLWWEANLLQIEFNRRLARFDRAAAHIETLPKGALEASGPIADYTRQQRALIEARNDRVAMFE